MQYNIMVLSGNELGLLRCLHFEHLHPTGDTCEHIQELFRRQQFVVVGAGFDGSDVILVAEYEVMKVIDGCRQIIHV